MAAKCNIAKLVLGDLYKIKWGLNLKSNTLGIIENYAESLNCPNVILPGCSTEDCTQVITTFTCEFNVINMSFYIEDGKPYFSINVGNYIGGTEPFSYQWFFDETIFTTSGELDTDTLILTVKPGKELDLLVTGITVVITDANGCEDTKTCYITPEGLKCSNNYAPCSNPSALTIVNTFVQCSGPSGLIITKV